MGCGGSRADAIEPRYHESWTRETESTWLTNTDAEIPNGVTYKTRVVRGECSHLIKDNAKVSGRGTEARAFGDRGRRMVNTGTQCGKQVLTSSTCTNHQRTSCGHEVTSIKNYQLFMKHYSLRCIILQTSGFCQCTDKADQEIVKEQLCQCLNNIKSVFHLI
ncbi:brain and acute leukemia cytoplasmic protein isoform X1 [Ctenopharyngodon idella]|uniref:brain and acute leukemia cytoplasmic protein isoform X1 n=1 Tax=Ctenopharyngodon idella TaxID=7959 RepID=UPI00223082C9|nr:brain and acute leukemia cytoplasmic protein isoform X1 [Ctenopharyngodon idella]